MKQNTRGICHVRKKFVDQEEFLNADVCQIESVTPETNEHDEGIDIAAKLSEAEGREADQNPRTASLLPRDLLCVSPIPTEVIKLGKTSDQSSTPSSSRCVTRKSSLNSITAPAEDKRRLCRELSRLDIYLPQQTQEGCVHQMRTRSADVALDNAAMRNLRSAFKFGVTKLFRQVSDSFTSMF